MLPADPDLSMLRVIFNTRRQASGWTFEELAERSGVARQTLLNLSSGRYRGDLLTWLRLSRAFGGRAGRAVAAGVARRGVTGASLMS